MSQQYCGLEKNAQGIQLSHFSKFVFDEREINRGPMLLKGKWGGGGEEPKSSSPNKTMFPHAKTLKRGDGRGRCLEEFLREGSVAAEIAFQICQKNG